jgi:hypothetical protein
MSTCNTALSSCCWRSAAGVERGAASQERALPLLIVCAPSPVRPALSWIDGLLKLSPTVLPCYGPCHVMGGTLLRAAADSGQEMDFDRHSACGCCCRHPKRVWHQRVGSMNYQDISQHMTSAEHIRMESTSQSTQYSVRKHPCTPPARGLGS